MKLNIIVPCYNGKKFIPYFLEDVSNLKVPEGISVELIIVDNASTDGSLDLVSNESKRFNLPISIKVLSYTERAGSYPARNFGVKQSEGEVLAFTDIDCRLPSDYLVCIHNIVQSKEYGFIVAGDVKLFLSEKPNLYEYYDYVFGFNMKSYVSQNTGVTANALIDRNTFERAGGFDMVESGGDRMFFKKALNLQGVRYDFISSLEIFHPCRNSYKELTKKAKRVGRGLAFYASKKSFYYKVKYVLKNILGAFLQVNQLKVILRSKEKRRRLSWVDNAKLIALIFWMGFYSRLYIVYAVSVNSLRLSKQI